MINRSAKILYYVFIIILSGIFSVHAADNPFDWNAYTEAEPWKAVGSKIPWPKAVSREETKVAPPAEEKWEVVSPCGGGRKYTKQPLANNNDTKQARTSIGCSYDSSSSSAEKHLFLPNVQEQGNDDGHNAVITSSPLTLMKKMMKEKEAKTERKSKQFLIMKMMQKTQLKILIWQVMALRKKVSLPMAFLKRRKSLKKVAQKRKNQPHQLLKFLKTKSLGVLPKILPL